MARPQNSERRTAILEAFDKQPICSIKDIMNMVPEEHRTSYQSTRKMILKMESEGLLSALPERGDNNQTYYVKSIFKAITRFVDYEGNNVSLKEFVHKLMGLESELVDSNAMMVIKSWMLDVLASSIPVAYSAKKREIPDDEELIKKLNAVLAQTRQLHMFIKSFMDADIWSPVARERLAKEFHSTCVEEHVLIVDRGWLEDERE